MEVVFRLRALLRQHSHDKRGVITEIEEACRINRHTAARLYRGECTTIPFTTLTRLTDWLIEKKDVPARDLPGALFGTADLWDRLPNLSVINLYLGEYHAEPSGHARPTWLSRNDVAVYSHLVRKFALSGSLRDLQIHYVPFEYVLSGNTNPRKELQTKWLAASEKSFKQLLGTGDQAVVNLMIGSQRVNLLVERFVAHLWDLPAFIRGSRESVPFRMIHDSPPGSHPSCFSETSGKHASGLLYRKEVGQWEYIPITEESDAGIVIIDERPDGKRIDVALFGYSGRATFAIGLEFLERPEVYRLMSMSRGGPSVAVFVCTVDFSRQPADDGGNIGVVKANQLPLDALGLSAKRN
jgi:hypothetical protein